MNDLGFVLESRTEPIEVLDALLDKEELRKSSRPTVVYLIKVSLLTDDVFFRGDQFFALDAFFIKVVERHEDLSMLCGLLELLSGDLLVLCHHASLQVLKLLKVLLFLRNVIVKLNLLGDCILCLLGDLNREIIQLLGKALLVQG